MGPGAKDFTVSGNNQSRVFNVASGATVEISGLTVTGGRAIGSTGLSGFNGTTGTNGQAGSNGGDTGGGGVLNNGTLTLRDVAVSSNTATGGAGGTGGQGGDGRDNTCSSNDNGGNGGTGGNGGNARGGGILNEGTLTLQGTAINSNTAQGGAGGGGGHGGRGGDDSSLCIGGNGGGGGSGAAGGAGRGGAVFNSGTLNATNSTLDRNTATGGRGGHAGSGGAGGLGASRGDGGNGGNGGAGGAGEGGATQDTGANATLTNATVSDNQALRGSGGFGGFGGSGSPSGTSGISGSAGTDRGGSIFTGSGTSLKNSIVAANSASTSGPNIFGTFTSGGHNLVGDPSGASGFLASDLQNGDPKLAPLQDNGGQTRTRALQPGSSALDQGNSFGTTTDQRGSPRPVDLPNVSNVFGGDGSDIGAVEVTAPDTTIANGPSGITRNTSASFSFTSTETDAVFQCSLDGSAFSPCISPHSYTALKNGKHTFRVRAVDKAGDIDPTPAARSWTVDTIKPTVSGVSPRHTSIIRDTTPTITATVKDRLTNLQKRNIKVFVAGKAIPASKFRYSAATDKLTYNSPKLPKGKKTVKIVATDAAKNVGTKSWYFTIR